MDDSDFLDWELCAEDLDDSSLDVRDQNLFRHEHETPPTAIPTTAPGADISISASTIFYPESKAVDVEPDSVVTSCDGVVFYLNSAKLSAAGVKELPMTPIQDAWLDSPTIARVTDSASVLTVILCAVHDIPPNIVGPTTDDICVAIDRMPNYALNPRTIVRKGCELHTLLMTHHAPFRPLLVFSTAACHEIDSLAQDVSSHLLGLEPVNIDDASAVKMGAIYLRKLILFNLNRVAKLKEIVKDTSPGNHALGRRTRGCSHAIQTAMAVEWGFTMKKLLWDAKSDMSPSVIREICRQAAEELPCKDCKDLWYSCSDVVATQWAQIKFTI